MSQGYDPARLDARWQAQWEAEGLYLTPEDPARPKWYALTPLLSLSGAVTSQQWLTLLNADVQARYRRMRGYNVLFPIGFDAFGLRAQDEAIKNGETPQQWTARAVPAMREQIRRMGCMLDWQREIVTSRPEFYRWTQWLFIRLWHEGYIYRAKAPCRWCYNCMKALSEDERSAEDCCRYCGSPTTERGIDQWLFRSTRYAEEMLRYDGIHWPQQVKDAQREYIGRRESIEIDFDITHESRLNPALAVTTNRPETVCGATFVALAPEHAMAKRLTKFQQRSEVDAYIQAARQMNDAERRSPNREPTGAFTGSYCVNQATGEHVPIWIADYLTRDDAAGAMGVPAHDKRDFAFARRYGLSVKVVVAPPGWSGEEFTEAYEDDGLLVNSGRFDGLESGQAREAVLERLISQGIGRRSVSYRMPDRVLSRQTYWGTPIPFVYCNMCGIVPFPDHAIPDLLPDVAELLPNGQSPLKDSPQYRTVICFKCYGKAERDTDTLDNLVCASWYHLRFTSPDADDLPFDLEKSDYWLPVEQYNAEAEGATRQLLSARYFWKALRDLGVVSGDEPFLRLPTHSAPASEEDDIIQLLDEFGADAVRVAFLASGDCRRPDIEQAYRWLKDIWDMASSARDNAIDPSTRDTLLSQAPASAAFENSKSIEAGCYGEALGRLKRLSEALMEAREEAGGDTWHRGLDAIILLLAPFTPHLAEDLWRGRGNSERVHLQHWPEAAPVQ